MVEIAISIEELQATNKVLEIMSELPPGNDHWRDLAYTIVLSEISGLIKRVREIDDKTHMGGDADASDPGRPDRN